MFKCYGDVCGYFCEIWNKVCMVEQGFDYDFVQDNQSFSVEVGIVWGLYF